MSEEDNIVRNQCTDKEIVKKMTIYKLPFHRCESLTCGTSSVIRKFSFGESNQFKEDQRKTILLMGAIGSGKKTLINALINYVLNVQLEDDFRFVLDTPNVNASPLVSAYNIHHRQGSRMPFPLTIIDTPRLGDTGGLDRDKMLAIAEFVHHHNIKEHPNYFILKGLDAVCFVVQSSLARLDNSYFSTIDLLMETFGKDIEKNILFLTTFADGGSPQVLAAIKELPCKKDPTGSPYYKSFSNGSIYQSPAINERQQLRFQLEWDENIDNFKSFFDDINKMEPLSLLMMSEHNLQLLEAKLERLQQSILHPSSNNKEELKVLIPVYKKVKGPPSQVKNNLNCKNCQTTCHYPCDPNFPTGWCEVFSVNQDQTYLDKVVERLMNTFSRNNFCHLCPGKCPKADHIYENSGWIYQSSMEEPHETRVN